jgi:hypothetical protein
MKRIILLFPILMMLVWAVLLATEFRLSITIGTPFIAGTAAANQSATTNAATNWVGITHTFATSQTVNKIFVMVDSVTGTLNAGDLSIDIFTDTNSLPSASAGAGCNSTTVTTVPTGALFVEWTGLTCAVSAAPYHLVIKNLNGTPAANFFTIRYSAAESGYPSVYSSGNTTSFSPGRLLTSTNSGSAWTTTTNSASIAYYRVESSGGIFSGVPVNSQGGDASNIVYSAREVGSVATSPSAGLKVHGIWLPIFKSGTPTGNARAAIYTGSSGTLTNLGYTNLVLAPGALSTANRPQNLRYNSPVTVPANSTFRVVLAESAQSDTSSNSYRTQRVTLHNEANSLALMPFLAAQP